MSVGQQLLVLVDEDDNEIGSATRAECHHGDGILHRAFSLHLLNSSGEVLIQQRAAQKQLWPGFWSNTCCSHPRVGEDPHQAVIRRTREELGIEVAPAFLYKFSYRERFADVGSENELCSVYIANSDAVPQPDPDEISDWRFVSPDGLDAELAAGGDGFTPWFRMEWQRLRSEFAQWF